jgi:pyrimidine-specific ribonucleoside hydrolase
MRLWVDTDVGDDPDDAIALLCARAHPDVEIVGVSTVDGDLERRVRLAEELVDAPVYRGDDPGLAAALTEAGPDALLAIGPLTNVAALSAAGAPLPSLTLMGGVLGTIRHWGVVLDVEHNFSRDPAAARQVIAGSHPVVVPLNVTLLLRLQPHQLDRLLAAAPVLVPSVEAFLGLQRDFGLAVTDRAVFLHDPLAFLTLVEPTFVQAHACRLAVDPAGRVREAPSGAPAQVVRSVDAPTAIDRVLGLVAQAGG